MFDLGLTEIVFIAVVAIIVIAPKDLPAAMRTVAKTVRAARRMWRDVQREFDEVVRVDELNDIRREVGSIRRQTDAEFMSGLNPSQAARPKPTDTPPMPEETPGDVASSGSVGSDETGPAREQGHPRTDTAVDAETPPAERAADDPPASESEPVRT